MRAAASRSIALAASTLRDLARRPGGVVALLVTGTLLLLLPRLARRALDDGATLGLELVLSTIALHASLLGGLIGVQAGAAGSPLGPVPEFLATPISWGEYVAGRFVGVCAAALIHAAALLLVALAAIATLDPHGLPHLGAVAAGALTIGLQTCLFVAAGLTAGAFAGAPLGTVLLAAFFVAARLAVPALSADAPLAALLVPDPARADLARVIALERPLGAAAWCLITASAVLQSAGLLMAAHWRLAIGRSVGATDAA